MALQTALRTANVPVIARVEHDRLWLDPRTLMPGDADRILEAIAHLNERT